MFTHICAFLPFLVFSERGNFYRKNKEISRRKAHTNTWKFNWNVLMITDVFLNQKEVCMWTHRKDGAIYINKSITSTRTLYLHISHETNKEFSKLPKKVLKTCEWVEEYLSLHVLSAEEWYSQCRIVKIQTFMLILFCSRFAAARPLLKYY